MGARGSGTIAGCHQSRSGLGAFASRQVGPCSRYQRIAARATQFVVEQLAPDSAGASSAPVPKRCLHFCQAGIGFSHEPAMLRDLRGAFSVSQRFLPSSAPTLVYVVHVGRACHFLQRGAESSSSWTSPSSAAVISSMA